VSVFQVLQPGGRCGASRSARLIR